MTAQAKNDLESTIYFVKYEVSIHPYSPSC